MQDPDLDIAKACLIAVILQEDMAFGCFSKIIPDLVFADSNEIFIGLGPSFVFQHLYAVEVMLHVVIGVDDNTAGVPLSDGPDNTFWLVRGDQVVKAGQGT